MLIHKPKQIFQLINKLNNLEGSLKVTLSGLSALETTDDMYVSCCPSTETPFMEIIIAPCVLMNAY